MTFDETIKSLTPAFKHIAFIEPWTMGGKVGGRLIVRHHDDLPKVFGYVWKFHPSYNGPLQPGDLVFHPRYASELIRQGTQDVNGKPVNWELHAIDVEVIEAVIDRNGIFDVQSKDATADTSAQKREQVQKEGASEKRHGRTYPRASE
jgi:hypothetical protein